MSSLLKNEVEMVLCDLIMQYGWHVKSINENEVILVTASYAIGISLDRDGLSFMYYDLSQPKKKGFNLALFLINKRRDQLTYASTDKSDKPLPEYLKHNLEVFAHDLSTACTDILRGDKNWIKQYSWPTVDVDENILKAIKPYAGNKQNLES